MSSFSDLPQELLSDISHRLGLIDLLSFRSVCRSTRSASSDSFAAIESSPESLPWFLLYGHDDSTHCSIVDTNYNNPRRYDIHLPEIAHSTCVASLDGWLLFLSPDSSMFFFCPFSRAKINLPKNCPFALCDLHFAAAFSHSPTHTECSVVVLRRNWEFLELCLLRRGESQWRRYDFYYLSTFECRKTMSVIHHEGAFHFVDDTCAVMIFNEKLKENWSKGVIVLPDTNRDDENGGVYDINTNYRLDSESNKIKSDLVCSISLCGTSKEMKSVLGIEEACCINICGTLISKTDCVYHLIWHEKYIDGTEYDDIVRRQLKGVWIQPRFHQISPNQSWSL